MASETEIKNKRLTVDTDRLRYDADSVISDLDRVQAYISDMYNDVSALNGMWKGKANEAFTKHFADDYSEMKSYINDLKSMAETIREQSRKYETCENEVKLCVSNINIWGEV